MTDYHAVPRPLLGIAFKVISTMAFTVMATLIKLLSDRYPIGELAFFRSFFALIPVFVWVIGRGRFSGVFATSNIRGHFFRSLAGVSAMFCGFTALSLLPIADAIAIGYASPLIVVVLAVFLLGEKVNMYRWSAVGVGLFGVLVILSSYFNPQAREFGGTMMVGAALAIGGAFLGALAATQVRRLTRFERAATIVIYFSLFSSLAALLTLPFGWVVPDAADLGLLVAAGICGGVGQVLLTQGFRFGDASMIAPFEYTSMIWALIVSLVVFGTEPGMNVLVGASIVIAAGLFVIYREHRLGIERNLSKQAQTPTAPLS